VSEVEDKTGQTSKSSDVQHASKVAEVLKAEIAALKIEQEKTTRGT